MMICDDHDRRETIRASQTGTRVWNGLDYLEVEESIDPITLEVRPMLRIFFLNKLGQLALDARNVRITGGRRITKLRVLDATPQRPEDTDTDDTLEIVLDRAGDFSTYTLELVKLDELGQPTHEPLEGFDPRYRQLEFSFRPDCPSDLDCSTPQVCPVEVLEEPNLNYLAKDYASFKQLIFDRLALLMPDWAERHVPDLGVVLVELFAYVGDHLSYWQDSIATEAYLDTARQRISVRRHARLVDYAMSEGCNARAFVHVFISQDQRFNTKALQFITGLNDALKLADRVLTWADLQGISSELYEVFEPLTPHSELHFYQAHNEINFYTWGEHHCCLRTGATSATLKDGRVVSSQPPANPEHPNANAMNVVLEEQRVLHLEPGDVLIFEEVVGARTGNPADADPRHRHAVRLKTVTKGMDELLQQPVLEVEWCSEDALPFDLCLSAQSQDCRELEGISVARGNVVLVDHGRRFSEDVGEVLILETPAPCDDCGCGGDEQRVPGEFKAQLGRVPLTHAQPLEANFCATGVIVQDVKKALPWIELVNQAKEIHQPNHKQHWLPRRDLLASTPEDRHFVAEIDNDGVAHLRFGDGELGAQPEAGHAFQAHYRVGNGLRGNVGANAISHMIFEQEITGLSVQPRNPLPASGGIAAETMDEVKLFAPFAIRETLERAISADDYARLAERLFPNEVARAAASLRWTGSWHEVLVAIDARGRTVADQALLERIARSLERYRRIGHEVRVHAAQLVPLEVKLEVCVLTHYVRGHVKAALLERFNNRNLKDGSHGFFHPDELSFAEGVFVSRIVAAARGVAGVESVRVLTLKRYGQPDNGAVERGVLELGALEIARLDNDPSLPEHGVFKLEMRGGR